MVDNVLEVTIKVTPGSSEQDAQAIGRKMGAAIDQGAASAGGASGESAIVGQFRIEGEKAAGAFASALGKISQGGEGKHVEEVGKSAEVASKSFELLARGIEGAGAALTRASFREGAQSLETFGRSAGSVVGSLEGFAGSFGPVGEVIATATSALLAWKIAEYEVAEHTAEAVNQFNELARATGMTGAQFAQLEIAAREAGLPIEALYQVVRRVSSRIQEEWGEIARSARDSKDEQTSAALAIADAQRKVQDAYEATGAAVRKEHEAEKAVAEAQFALAAEQRTEAGLARGVQTKKEGIGTAERDVHSTQLDLYRAQLEYKQKYLNEPISGDDRQTLKALEQRASAEHIQELQTKETQAERAVPAAREAEQAAEEKQQIQQQFGPREATDKQAAAADALLESKRKEAAASDDVTKALVALVTAQHAQSDALLKNPQYLAGAIKAGGGGVDWSIAPQADIIKALILTAAKPNPQTGQLEAPGFPDVLKSANQFYNLPTVPEATKQAISGQFGGKGQYNVQLGELIATGGFAQTPTPKAVERGAEMAKLEPGAKQTRADEGELRLNVRDEMMKVFGGLHLEEVSKNITGEMTSAVHGIATGAVGIGNALDAGAGKIREAIKGLVDSIKPIPSSAAPTPGTGAATPQPAHVEGGLISGPGMQVGGLIRGPGTGTSDSISTALPANSFVLKASVTEREGEDKLNAINEMRFAQGGSANGSVPVRVSDGEYHFSPEAVQHYGVEWFQRLNSGATRLGDTNKTGLAGGGLVEALVHAGEGTGVAAAAEGAAAMEGAAVADVTQTGASTAKSAVSGPAAPATRQYHEPSLKPYTPSWSERVQATVQDTMAWMGASKTFSQEFGERSANIAGFTPFVGSALSANQAWRDYQGGHYVSAGLNLAAALPIPATALGMHGVERTAHEIASMIADQSGSIALGKSGSAIERKLSPLGLYSHGAEAAAALPQAKGTAEQMIAQLMKQGVKPEEMKWAGVEADKLAPMVTKERLANRFETWMPQLQETQLQEVSRPARDAQLQEMIAAERASIVAHQMGRADAPERLADFNRLQAEYDTYSSNKPKHAQWVLPGGQNYREVLMHLPEQPSGFGVFRGAEGRVGPLHASPADARAWAHSNEVQGTVREVSSGTDFHSSHWDTPNVVAHLRLNDRTGVQGEKMLHMEELQSDWGQAGRKTGFKQSQEEYMRLNDAAMDRGDRTESNRLHEAQQHGTPQAPYVTSTQGWTQLGLKRALIEAARGDYTHLSWTGGAEQAARYDLSKHVSALSYNSEGQNLQGLVIDGGRLDKDDVSPDKLSEHVGKEVAEKLLATPKGPHFNSLDEQRGDWHTLSGLDLKVGGEGMHAYYDKIVPTELSKIVKRLDPEAKIGISNIEKPYVTPKSVSEPLSVSKGGHYVVPSIEITSQLREQIRKGLPAFETGGIVDAPVFYQVGGLVRYQQGGPVPGSIEWPPADTFHIADEEGQKIQRIMMDAYVKEHHIPKEVRVQFWFQDDGRGGYIIRGVNTSAAPSAKTGTPHPSMDVGLKPPQPQPSHPQSFAPPPMPWPPHELTPKPEIKISADTLAEPDLSSRMGFGVGSGETVPKGPDIGPLIPRSGFENIKSASRPGETSAQVATVTEAEAEKAGLEPPHPLKDAYKGAAETIDPIGRSAALEQAKQLIAPKLPTPPHTSIPKAPEVTALIPPVPVAQSHVPLAVSSLLGTGEGGLNIMPLPKAAETGGPRPIHLSHTIAQGHSQEEGHKYGQGTQHKGVPHGHGKEATTQQGHGKGRGKEQGPDQGVGDHDIRGHGLKHGHGEHGHGEHGHGERGHGAHELINHRSHQTFEHDSIIHGPASVMGAHTQISTPPRESHRFTTFQYHTPSSSAARAPTYTSLNLSDLFSGHAEGGYIEVATDYEDRATHRAATRAAGRAGSMANRSAAQEGEAAVVRELFGVGRVSAEESLAHLMPKGIAPVARSMSRMLGPEGMMIGAAIEGALTPPTLEEEKARERWSLPHLLGYASGGLVEQAVQLGLPRDEAAAMNDDELTAAINRAQLGSTAESIVGGLARGVMLDAETIGRGAGMVLEAGSILDQSAMTALRFAGSGIAAGASDFMAQTMKEAPHEFSVRDLRERQVESTTSSGAPSWYEPESLTSPVYALRQAEGRSSDVAQALAGGTTQTPIATATPAIAESVAPIAPTVEAAPQATQLGPEAAASSAIDQSPMISRAPQGWEGRIVYAPSVGASSGPPAVAPDQSAIATYPHGVERPPVYTVVGGDDSVSHPGQVATYPHGIDRPPVYTWVDPGAPPSSDASAQPTGQPEQTFEQQQLDAQRAKDAAAAQQKENERLQEEIDKDKRGYAEGGQVDDNLPGAPLRPKPPPSRGLLQEMLPVNPIEVVGGFYQQVTEGAGDIAARGASAIRLPNPELFGHTITEMLQSSTFGGGMSPMHGAMPMLAAAPMALALRGGRVAKAAKEATSAARTPGQTALDEMIHPTVKQIEMIKARAAELKDAVLPTAAQPIFSTSPEALARTQQLVPQHSIRHLLPGPDPGDTLPKRGRAQPIVEHREALGAAIAARLRPLVEHNDPTLHFYSTGPVIEGLMDEGGLSQEEAIGFMRDWSGQGAATSPQSTTPRNLKNASWLQYKRAIGEPVNLEGWTPAQNTPGYPMMTMHVRLGEQFATDTVNPSTNPKPFTFREAWSGNMADVVVDSHNIRATLWELDQLHPGTVQREWFTTQAHYDKYKAAGSFAAAKTPMESAIDVTVEGKQTEGGFKRTEYNVLAEPWYIAAKHLGIDPSMAQSAGWFSYGNITGLRSPAKMIPDLLNDQIEDTAKTLGVEQKQILRWLARREIPLTGVGALAGLAGIGALEQQSDQAKAAPAFAEGGDVTEEARKGKFGEMKPYVDPTFGGFIGRMFEHGAEWAGGPMSVIRRAGEIGETIGGATGLDLPFHASQAVRYGQHGDYSSAVGEMFGALPVIPGAGVAHGIERGVVHDIERGGTAGIGEAHAALGASADAARGGTSAGTAIEVDRGGGSEGVRQAQERAAKVAGAHTPLHGLPQPTIQFGENYYVPGPIGRIKDITADYMKQAGLPYKPQTEFVKLDKERAAKIAGAFEAMPNAPEDPAVKASYAALAKETLAQWHAVKSSGLQVEWIKPGQPDPYAANPRMAAMDVAQNNHWWGFRTEAGYGTGDETSRAANPMLADSGEVVGGHKAVINDLFRVVHDYFGHFKEGVGFRGEGEDNAWRSHASMFSKEALPAMTAETRGQNSWVNYGPYGERNRNASAADTHYSPQKIGIMPEWTTDDIGKGNKAELKYPIAPKSEWYGDANYEQTGGSIKWMHPDEFLSKARPLEIEETARDNINDLKEHITSGRTLDPLALYATGKEDGRHRAHAAKELGISRVPVISWPRGEDKHEGGLISYAAGGMLPTSFALGAALPINPTAIFATMQGGPSAVLRTAETYAGRAMDDAPSMAQMLGQNVALGNALYAGVPGANFGSTIASPSLQPQGMSISSIFSRQPDAINIPAYGPQPNMAGPQVVYAQPTLPLIGVGAFQSSVPAVTGFQTGMPSWGTPFFAAGGAVQGPDNKDKDKDEDKSGRKELAKMAVWLKTQHDQIKQRQKTHGVEEWEIPEDNRKPGLNQEWGGEGGWFMNKFSPPADTGAKNLYETHRSRMDKPGNYPDAWSTPIDALAYGGAIQGPGGPREDRVPIWASNGEYIVNAPRVAEEGVDKLHALNRGEARIVRYARGGEVEDDWRYELPAVRTPSYATGGVVGESRGSAMDWLQGPERFANGGLVTAPSAPGASPTHIIDLRTDVGTFRMQATPDVVDQMLQSSIAARVTTTGTTSWRT